MRTLFRTGLAFSAMTIVLPTIAPAQTTGPFDGNYGGVSIQGSGGRSCTVAGPVPRPLTISGGNAQTSMGMQGDIVFQGPVGPQGVLMLRSPKGTIISGRVDAGGNASGQLAMGVCSYEIVWRKK